MYYIVNLKNFFVNVVTKLVVVVVVVNTLAALGLFQVSLELLKVKRLFGIFRI